MVPTILGARAALARCAANRGDGMLDQEILTWGLTVLSLVLVILIIRVLILLSEVHADCRHMRERLARVEAQLSLWSGSDASDS